MRKKGLYDWSKQLASLLMMVALLWLTVSMPYVYRYQQQVKAEKQALAFDSEDEDGGTLNNTNEEKAESGPNTLQEYLHEPLHLQHPTVEQVNEYGHFEQTASVAFHPEYVSPPPEV